MKHLIVSLLAVMAIFSACSASRGSEESDKSDNKEDKPYNIPKDLDECFAELKKRLKPEDVEKIKGGEKSDVFFYHSGVGRWIRNNWGLWKGSHLAKWFNAQGIQHPDDMSTIILLSFWEHLNQKPITFERRVRHHQNP